MLNGAEFGLQVDASQDLLIIRHGTTPCVVCRCHLLALTYIYSGSASAFFNIFTLSEGLPHPQAALRSFRISNTGPHRGSTAGAFIRREWVYLLDQSFEIYNWKTGERNEDNYVRSSRITVIPSSTEFKQRTGAAL